MTNQTSDKPRNFFAQWNRLNRDNLRRVRRGRQASIGIYGVMMDEIDKSLQARSKKRQARYDRFAEMGETMRRRFMTAVSEELQSEELNRIKDEVTELKATLAELQDTANEAAYMQPISLPPLPRTNGHARRPH